ncbi:MAG TPA: carbamate kinase, partial [Candidatus Limnocylindrales bacterium]|nr:carbamate kinase [Candidatus Limnocylindrales bacterium]
QVGYLAIQAEAARALVPPPPLDVLVAETQGEIGYLLVQALDAELSQRGIDRPVVAVMTQTVVDPDDAAFDAPSKPIGPMYDEPTARSLAASNGWTVAPDGDGWRRVVASPRPRSIVEAPVIRAIADSGAVVVASGGGGIPVTRAADRRPGEARSAAGCGRVLREDFAAPSELVGVEAVVDKDLEAVVLAQAVDADALLLLTDVRAVHLGWGGANPIPIRQLLASAARAGVANGTFPRGSMGPKVEAAAQFASSTGRLAAIGALDEAADVLAGRSGTLVVADPRPIVSAPVSPGARPASRVGSPRRAARRRSAAAPCTSRTRPGA